MTDIAVPYFHARPVTDPPWPGVVVVPEGNGMSPQLLRVCQRLAHEGYAVAAPDIFWRVGGSDPQRSLHELAKMRMRELVQDVYDCADVLRGSGATKVGVTGFCLGGRVTYAAATWEGATIDAAAPFYGAGIDKKLGTATCPMLLFFGGRDEYISLEEIEKVQAHHGDAVVVYPGAEHGFMRDGSPSYSPEATADAWPRLLTFFARHLGGTS
ncbi:MAG: dienelactone hydrolase family protein [Actinomycetes bacterium]